MAKELIENNEGRVNAFRMKPEDVRIIGIDTKDGPEHPLWDERIKTPITPEFVRSILTYGVLQIVKVTVSDGVPCVVDGRRRTLAARMANEILREEHARSGASGEPALITLVVQGENAKKVSDSTLGAAMVTMNEQRLDDGPLVKAAKAERLRLRGTSDAELAIIFGVSVQTIRDWALLSGLSTPVKKAVEAGTVSAHAAAQLGALPKEEQAAKLEEILASGVKPTAREVKERTKPVDEGEDRVVRPSGRIVKKLIAAEGTDLPEGFLLALRWMRGEISEKKIKGLSAALKELA